MTALAEFRYQIRRFLRFSEQAAREAGLEPQHHQLLLAVIGAAEPPSVGELAERLQLLPHSTDELIRRAEANGLVRRRRSQEDRRMVHVDVEEGGCGRRVHRTASSGSRCRLRARRRVRGATVVHRGGWSSLPIAE